MWQTLQLLVARPGQLTREFIAERHQQYLPPFRLYLVISLFFFALSALLPDSTSHQPGRAGRPRPPKCSRLNTKPADDRKASSRGAVAVPKKQAPAELKDLTGKLRKELEAGRRAGESTKP